MPLKIFLIGLPGSGKSTLGKQLADVLHLPFIDLDMEIERECRKPIAEIFKSAGEAWFREKEAQVLRKVSDAGIEFVMATGGGTPCFHDGIDFMNRIGITIFLDVPVAIISDRIRKEGTDTRPLLSKEEDNEISSAISKLYAKRQSYYLKATHRVCNEYIELSTLLSIINKEKIKN